MKLANFFLLAKMQEAVPVRADTKAQYVLSLISDRETERKRQVERDTDRDKKINGETNSCGLCISVAKHYV